MHFTTTVIAAILLTTGLLAQTRPDFSGVWVLDRIDTTGGGTGGRRGGGGGIGGGVGLGPPPTRLAISQDFETMTLESRGTQGTATIRYTFDGRSVANTILVGGGGAPANVSYRSQWADATLATRIDLQGRQLRETMSLNNAGELVVDTRMVGSGGRSAIYKKAS